MAFPGAHAHHVPRPPTRAFVNTAEPAKPAVKGSKIAEPPRQLRTRRHHPRRTGHVRFRGMPNSRFWDFETAATDFGAIIPDPRDLPKLLLADFLLLHGDDWLLASLDVQAGSLCWIDPLTVTDVFGVTEAIDRADALPGTRWTAFSTTDASGAPTPFLVIPASAAAVAQSSAPLEVVDLLRAGRHRRHDVADSV